MLSVRVVARQNQHSINRNVTYNAVIRAAAQRGMAFVDVKDLFSWLRYLYNASKLKHYSSRSLSRLRTLYNEHIQLHVIIHINDFDDNSI